MPTLENLVYAEKLLTKRFKSLRDARKGPVFFIEHGLSKSQVERLRKTVSRVAAHFPLQTSRWERHPFPLLVVATEVGYSYRGTGTDFWPKLEFALGTDISAGARQNVRDLFEGCASKHRGARPPETPWTQAFRLIAWPVTHALVPLEFHSQLSAALVNLKWDVQRLDDDRLHRAVRTAARRPSARFEAFLAARSHAVPIVRALLGGAHGEVSQDVIARIDSDLRTDRGARLNIESARRRQRTLRERVTPTPEPTPRESITGLLQLRLRSSGQLSLEARFPVVQGPEVERLRRFLRRRRFVPRLWGVASQVPSERFFSGVPFPVNLRSVPQPDTALFEDVTHLGIDRELLPLLESFQLDFHLPMLFAPSAECDLAHLVRGGEVSASRTYWLLVNKERGDLFIHLPKLGDVGPLVCHRMDASQTDASEALQHMGYRVRHGIPVSIAGAPPLDGGAALPRFLVGDERIVVPKAEDQFDVQVELGSERVVMDGNLVRVRVPEGQNVLQISSRQASRRESFEGIRRLSHEVSRSCWIELRGDDKTVQMLLGGGIALRIDGPAPLEGLTLTLELDIGGKRTGTSVLLDPLPQVLAAGQEPWRTLLDETTRDLIRADQGPVVVHAFVGALAEESWTLERNLRPTWWSRGSNGPFLDSELGPVEHGEVSVSRPAGRPRSAAPGARSDAVLLVALDPDEAVYGSDAGFATFCTAPIRTALSPPSIDRPRLRRARRGSAGSLGLQDLVEAWLRWSLAESDTAVADIRRRQVARQLDQWIAELACGETWANRECQMRASSADPWELLVTECRGRGLGIDELVEVSEGEQRELIAWAVAEIRRRHPDLWLRVGGPTVHGRDRCDSLLDDGDYADLDAACAGAYEQLAERYRKAGQDRVADVIKSADPGAPADQWDPVLERAVAGSQLWALGELLLPTDTAQRLVALDLTLAPLGELAEELHRWAIESRRALAGVLPSEETLRAILALWIAPDTATRMDWRSALDTLVAERPLARAARFLALRARSVRYADAS